MSLDNRIPLARALKFGEQICDVLDVFCDKIEIAGSIRRERPMVGDIDIVCVTYKQASLEDRLIAHHCHIERSGEQYIVAKWIQTGIQIDIWMAHPASADLFSSTPTNFGSVLLCRTGSKEHNIFLVEHAKSLGLRWHPHKGVFDGNGKLIASETEEDIFHALKLDFVPPQKREIKS